MKIFLSSFFEKVGYTRAAAVLGVALVIPVWGESDPAKIPFFRTDPGTTSGELTLGWASDYLDNGRSELPRGGFFTTELIGTSGPVSIGTWYGEGTSKDFREWNLAGTYSKAWTENLTTDFSILYVVTVEEGASSDDVELETGWAYRFAAGLTIEIAGVYSFDAGGIFIESTIAYPIALENRLEITPFTTIGFDFGFHTEDHKGPNHWEAGLEISYALTETFSIGVQSLHSFALRDIRREASRTGKDLGDETLFAVFATAGF